MDVFYPPVQFASRISRDSGCERKCAISASDPDSPAFWDSLRPRPAQYFCRAHDTDPSGEKAVRLLAVERATARMNIKSNHDLLSLWHHLASISCQSYWEPPRHYVGLILSRCFPICRYEVFDNDVFSVGMRYRFKYSSWLTSQRCPLQYFIDDRFSARMRAIGCQEFRQVLLYRTVLQ